MFAPSGSYRRHWKYIKLRNDAAKIQRRSQAAYETRLARNAKRNPKAFFRYAQSRRATRESVGLPLDGSERVSSSNKHKADLLLHFFESIHHIYNNTLPPGSYLFPSISTTMPNISFTTQEIHKQVAALNQYKSTGPDGLHPAILKPLAKVLSLPLATLFERSLVERRLPSD